jgi:Tfp pilus assembly protein FimT
MSPSSRSRALSRGITLVEMAIILLIIGVLVAGVIQGQQLIASARVRQVIAQQEAVSIAVTAFQDRFQALPGDYRDAPVSIACTPACVGGNGNGRVEESTTPKETILVWSHLSGAGFLNAAYAAGSAAVAVDPSNTAQNVVGGYMQVAFDSNWGFSTNTVRRHNVKTGNNLPVEVLAEIDRKIDDGLPASGRFQFSPYAAVGTAPSWGGTATSCVTSDGPNAIWNVSAGQANCGAASLL